MQGIRNAKVRKILYFTGFYKVVLFAVNILPCGGKQELQFD